MEIPPRPVLASDLFAWSQGSRNTGPDECHWCTAPCARLLLHDDDPPIPFVKGSHLRRFAKRPANGYTCLGCWLFRKKRTTVQYLNGKLRDSSAPMEYSWWITEKGAWAIGKEDGPALYALLLKPPLRFSLSLVTEDTQNHLQLQTVCNAVSGIQAEQQLPFTLNGAPLTYTIYELEEALRGRQQGVAPGVRALTNFLGPCVPLPVSLQTIPDNRGRGRPNNTDQPGKPNRKVMATSGSR